MLEVEKTCENCKYEYESMEGTHCKHCIHNASEHFEAKFSLEEKTRIITELLEKQLNALEDFKDWEDSNGYPIHTMSERQRISKCKELIKRVADEMRGVE